MRPLNSLQSMMGLARSFEPGEILLRGGRASRDIIFRGPRYRLPAHRVDILNMSIDSLFPNLSVDVFVQTIKYTAVIRGDTRRTLVQKMRAGDLRFLGDPMLLFENGHITWDQIPGLSPWPRIPSWKISFRHTANVYGDVKKIWNLNKHAQWIILACCDQDEATADDIQFLFGQWTDWMRDNPLGIGINWTSELEAAERAINWIICLCMFRKRLEQNGEAINNIARGLLEHGVFLEKRMTVWSYNHCIGESTALLMLANLFSGYSFAKKWKEFATSNLIRKTNAMVSDDGYYREKSPHYSLLVAQYLALAILLLEPADGKILREKNLSLINELRRITNRDGKLPNLGDNDNACILNYKFSEYMNVIDHPLFKLLEPKSAELSPIIKKRESHKSSFHIAVLRSGLYEAALNLDNVPISANVAPHIHDDVLHVSLWYNGSPVIIDSGTFCYSADKTKRLWYRSAAAHNRPRSSCIPESVQSGFFRWKTIVRGVDFDFLTNDGFSVAGGKINRGELMRYVFLNTSYCLIFDRIPQFKCNHSIVTTTFSFGKSNVVQQEGPGCYLISGFFGNVVVCSVILGEADSIHYEWQNQSFSEQYGSEEQGRALSMSLVSKESVWSVWCVSVLNSTEQIASWDKRIMQTDGISCWVTDLDGRKCATINKELDGLAVEIAEQNNTSVFYLPPIRVVGHGNP